MTKNEAHRRASQAGTALVGALVGMGMMGAFSLAMYGTGAGSAELCRVQTQDSEKRIKLAIQGAIDHVQGNHIASRALAAVEHRATRKALVDMEARLSGVRSPWTVYVERAGQ
jgi:hypothetical protein